MDDNKATFLQEFGSSVKLLSVVVTIKTLHTSPNVKVAEIFQPNHHMLTKSKF